MRSVSTAQPNQSKLDIQQNHNITGLLQKVIACINYIHDCGANMEMEPNICTLKNYLQVNIYNQRFSQQKCYIIGNQRKY